MSNNLICVMSTPFRSVSCLTSLHSVHIFEPLNFVFFSFSAVDSFVIACLDLVPSTKPVFLWSLCVGKQWCISETASKVLLRAFAQVAKVEGSSSLASCKLSLIFNWRKVEDQTHYPRVLEIAVGSKGWAQTDFSVINKRSCSIIWFPSSYLYISKCVGCSSGAIWLIFCVMY